MKARRACVSYWARNFPTGGPNQTENKNCRWPGGVAAPLSNNQKHQNFEIGTLVRHRICLLIGRRNPNRNPLGFALPEGEIPSGDSRKARHFWGLATQILNRQYLENSVLGMSESLLSCQYGPNAPWVSGIAISSVIVTKQFTILVFLNFVFHFFSKTNFCHIFTVSTAKKPKCDL